MERSTTSCLSQRQGEAVVAVVVGDIFGWSFKMSVLVLGSAAKWGRGRGSVIKITISPYFLSLVSSAYLCASASCISSIYIKHLGAGGPNKRLEDLERITDISGTRFLRKLQ